MRITNRNMKVLKRANKEINAYAKVKPLEMTSYSKPEILFKAEKTFYGFFHKMFLKVKIFFLNPEIIPDFEENKKFLVSLDAKIEQIKNDKYKENCFVMCSREDKYKSDVLNIFNDMFDGYETSRVECVGEYIHIYFQTNGLMGKREDFYISVYVDIKVDGTMESASITYVNELNDSFQDICLELNTPEGFVSSVKAHEKYDLRDNNMNCADVLQISDMSLVKLRNIIQEKSFLQNMQIDKIAFILNILARTFLYNLQQDKTKIFDGIALLKQMQSNIFDVEVEANIFYAIMKKYNLQPHKKYKLKELFLIFVDVKHQKDAKHFFDAEKYLFKV